MITERIQQSYTSAKYYQFYAVATILEHVIDCFHTIVSDETNPYHPPLSWLTRKQPRPPKDELFYDLFEECCAPPVQKRQQLVLDAFFNQQPHQLSSNLRSRLEKCTLELRNDIVSRTKDGCSPLFMACKQGHSSIVKYLLDFCGAQIEQKGLFETSENHHVHSVSPIWVAAVSGNIDIVKLLIEYKANINCLSDTGSTPLRSVCFLCKDDDHSQARTQALDDDEMVQQREEEEEDNDKVDIYFKIVKLLVENGADVSLSNYNGGTCLINSIHNYQLTKYIIEHGCETNASDNQSKTALHYAIQQGRLEVTKLLILHGADPMQRANLVDDALQLSCIGGHVEIFEHLIKTIKYPRTRLADAYKLLGSSVLEIHYDLALVREFWQAALRLKCERSTNNEGGVDNEQQQVLLPRRDTESDMEKAKICDSRRIVTFSDIIEFNSEQELQALTADEFRIQSLIISERILGSDHRELIQRLLYRGTFYINSLRPDRCVDLWIYALGLRLKHGSIFQFESIFAAKAVTKLIFDLLSQQQQQAVKFQDVYDLLELLINQLDICRNHLNTKPVSCVHEDIFDLLLAIIVNLLFALNYAASSGSNDKEMSRKLVKRLIEINPRSSNGSSLLHVCVSPSVFDVEALKLMVSKYNDKGLSSLASPVSSLIDTLIDNGLEVDSTNDDGLSALQVLCLAAGMRVSDKRSIIKRLVGSGAHIDRRPSTPEQGESILQALREAGVNPNKHLKLSCLAAKKVNELNIKFDSRTLARGSMESIAIH